MDCDLPTLQLDCLALSFYFQDRYRKGFWWLPNLTIPSYFCFFSRDKNQICDKVYTIKSGLSHLLWKVYKLTQKYNFLYFLAKVFIQIILFKRTLQARFVCLSTLWPPVHLQNKEPRKISHHLEVGFEAQFRISWVISAGIGLGLSFGN